MLDIEEITVLGDDEIAAVGGGFLPLIGAAVAIVGLGLAGAAFGYNVGRDIMMRQKSSQ